MKYWILAIFIASFFCVEGQELNLKAEHQAIDIRFIGNSNILLVNSEGYHSGSYAINLNNQDRIDLEKSFNPIMADVFVKVKDNFKALYLTTLSGKLYFNSTNLQGYGNSETEIKAEGFFKAKRTVCLPNNEEFIIAGISWEGAISGFENNRHSLFLMHVDDFAEVKMTKIYNDFDIRSVNEIALDDEGNYFVFASIYTTVPDICDYVIFKLDAKFSKLWTKTLPKHDFNIGGGMFVDEAGNLFINGSVFVEKDHSDIYLAKLSSRGELIWQKTYSDSKKNTAIELLPWQDTQLLSISKAFSVILGKTDSYISVAVFDRDGNEIRRLSDRASGCNMQPNAAAINNEGSLIVVGGKENLETHKTSASITRFSTRKLNGEQTFFWD